MFAALGDQTRLALIARLCAGPGSIKDLTAGSAVTRQAITKHLRVLADAGLARETRCGRRHIWEFQPAQLAEARRSLDEISRQWDAALDRLKKFVEN